jgi:hypothetical protein
VAKTRRVLFVEGKDFQIFARFALRLNYPDVGNRAEFAVVPIEGFNPERVRHLKSGMEHTLGTGIVAAVILDRDYRSTAECEAIVEKCKQFCDFVEILKRKEIENFLLVPTAIDRAAGKKVADRANRSGIDLTYRKQASELLEEFASERRAYVASQMLTSQRIFERTNSPQTNETTVTQSSFEAFEKIWVTESSRFNALPGKDALSAINTRLQDQFGISVTATSIIDAMLLNEVPDEMVQLLQMLRNFVAKSPEQRAT